METGLRPYQGLTAATILFAISLLSSVDAKGQTADFVGEDDDDAQTLSVPLEPAICSASPSHSHNPIGVRPHHKQAAVAPSDEIRRPEGLTRLIRPAPREYVSGILVGLIPARAPPSR